MPLTDVSSSLPIVSRLLAGAILLVASSTKCLNFRWFVRILEKYDLAPRQAVRLCAHAIVASELAVGTALLFGWRLPFSAYAALGLFLLFTAAISINLARGRFDIECGCASFWRRAKIGWHLVFRNLGLAGFAALAGGGTFIGRFSAYVFASCVILVLVPFLPSRSRNNESEARLGPTQIATP